MNTQTAEANSEFQESTSITFEWTLRGLKNLFDSTKGDTKSKVTKSARFGGGSWQVHSMVTFAALPVLMTLPMHRFCSMQTLEQRKREAATLVDL